MFSAIFELLAKLQELKLKKQKKDTKKEVKKAEKKLKEEGSSVVNVKDKAKKTKKVKDSKDNEKKIQIKVWILKVLKWVVEIIEQFVMFLISVIGVYGFFIILVVIVLMIAIYGLLHIDFDMSDGSIFRRSEEDCISTGQALQDTGFDMSQFSQLSSAYTDRQKNLMRTFQVYYQCFDGTFGKEYWVDKFPEVVNSVGKTTISAYLMGYVSVENGMEFNNGEKDVTKYSAHFHHNSQGYGGFGLESNATLNGNAPDVATKVREMYPQPPDYTGHDTDFVPYGAVIQATQMAYSSYPYFGLAYNFVKDNEADIEKVFAEYGVSANKDKLKTYLMFFGASTYYHGGGMNMSHVSNWTALWTATSSNDSEREFTKIEILNDSYAESTARPYFLGSNNASGISNCKLMWDQNVSTPYFKINGKEVTTTLWTFVRDNCSNKNYFLSTGANWIESKGANAAVIKSNGHVVLNSHYGILAYLMGQKILTDLGVSAPLTSGGSVDDCECVENPNGYAGSLDFANVKAGEVQGPWSEKVKAVLNGHTSISKYYGTAESIENPKKKLGSLNMTVEEWRQGTKWKIPYYFQNNSGSESAKGNIPSSWVSSLGSLGRAGCHIYMYSYMSSCLTGKVINPTEMTAALRHFGGITSSGLNSSSNAVSAFNDLGLKAVNVHSNLVTGDKNDFKDFTGIDASTLNSKDSTTLQKAFDALLEKNGVIGFAGARGYYTINKNHYVVCYDKTNDGYKVTGYNGGGSYPVFGWWTKGNKTTDGDTYNWDYVYRAMGSHSNAPGYNYQIFFAWNPNLAAGSMQLSSTSAGSNAVVFEKFLFVGDSHTELIKSKIEGENKGHIIKAVSGKDANYWNSNYTELQGHDVNGIVVGLGSNNTTDLDGMKKLLTSLKTDYPSKPIYVQKVFPVGDNYTYMDKNTNNSNIATLNDGLKSFCDGTDGFTFIDTTVGLVNESGFLANPDSEGIHLGKEEDRTKWWENIKSSINSGNEEINKQYTDDNCGKTSNASSISAGNLTEEAGKFQGPWGDLSQYVDKISNAKAKSDAQNYIQNRDKYIGVKPLNEGKADYEYKVDRWKQHNGKGFVRYSQGGMTGSAYTLDPLSSAPGGDSDYFYSSSCGAYSASGVLSTMLGKYITPIEVSMAITTYSIRHPGESLACTHVNGDTRGAYTHTDLAKIIEECGLKTETSDSIDLNKVDTCLQANGMVIFVVDGGLNNRFTDNSAHYIVIREKSSKGYLIYSSTNWVKGNNDDYTNVETTGEEVIDLAKSDNTEAQVIYITP